MKSNLGLIKQLAFTGLGSLTFTALAPLPTLAAPSITLKASFDGSGNGGNPYAALTPAGNGNFYGTTVNGGVNGEGSIFEFDSTSGLVTPRASFTGSGTGNGSNPRAALTPAGNGKFYGTTSRGGANSQGSIFEFDHSGSGSITLKASFNGTGTGSEPYAPLTPDGNGKFYGTASGGGANGQGSIFEFDPTGSGSITLKASFNGPNGNSPYAALTSAGNGKFYGTTYGGGANGQGSIFEFDPTGTGSITLKGSFDGSNGNNPYAALTPAGNGKFYGTTYGGGANGYGSIFEFDPSGSGSITLKASFDAPPGNARNPYAALTPATNGKFYGTSFGGANELGSIFEFDPSGSGSISLKASFDGTGNGAYPYAALTPTGNGNFYGTTYNNGPNGSGTIFEFDPGSNVSTPTPGPLPLMGAGAAFGWSRRLRRRIQQVRPVFPMGR